MALFSAIGAAIFGAGTFLAAATATLLKLAVGVTLNLIAASRAGKQAKPSFAVNGQLQGGGDVPRSIPFGYHATAGSLVWANTWGKDGDTKNAHLTQVICLADLPVKGLGGFWVNKQKVTIDFDRPHADGRGYPVTEYRSDGTDTLWIKFYDGTQTAVDSFLASTASNANRNYGGNRVGYGCAYAIVTALVSKNMFSGFPSFIFEIDGMRLYDISKDSTAGGNGTQRWTEPATWGGDGDSMPAVQLYNLFRGIRYNGNWLYGFQGVTGFRLPAANWVKQINKCRVLDVNGIPRYRSGAECPVEAQMTSAIEALLTACQGSISEVGGSYEIFLGEPDDPEFAINDQTIITTETQQFTPFFGLAEMVTGMSGTYPSPGDGWATKTAPPIIRPDLDARAGGRRLMANVPFDFVPYPEQVQRLLKSGLEDGLRQRRHTFTLPPAYLPRSRAGRTFSFTSPRNGYVNKLFKIDGVQILENCNVLIDCTECDPADYNWQSSDYKPQIDGALGPMRPLPTPIYDFGAEPSSITDEQGQPRRPAILLKWKGGVAGVDYVEYELELASDFSRVDNGYFLNVALNQDKIAPFAMLPATPYRVRARYGSYEGSVPFQWSEWFAVLTPDIRIGGKDLYPFNIGDFNESLQEVWRQEAENVRYIRDEVTRVSTILADNMADSSVQMQGIRETVSVQFGESRADYQRLILAEASERQAQVTSIEQLTAQLQTNVAQVTELSQATATEVSALSQSVTQVSARVNGVSADGYFRVFTEANQGGSLARIALSVSATAGGDPVSAAIFIEAIGGGKSRVIVDASEFYVSSAGNRNTPLAYINGELTLAVINVGTAYFDVLQARNGSLILRGYGNFGDLRLFTL